MIESVISYGLSVYYQYARVADLQKVAVMIYKCCRLILQCGVSKELLLYKSKILGIDELYATAGVMDISRILATDNCGAQTYAMEMMERAKVDDEPRWNSAMYDMCKRLQLLFGADVELEKRIPDRFWDRDYGKHMFWHEGTIRDDDELAEFLETNSIDVLYTTDGSCSDNKNFYKKGVTAGAAFIKTTLSNGETKARMIGCKAYTHAYGAEHRAYEAVLDDIIEDCELADVGDNIGITPDCQSMMRAVQGGHVKSEDDVRVVRKLNYIEKHTKVQQHVKHIKAHTGNKLNEMVDGLAKAACDIECEAGNIVSIAAVKAAMSDEVKRSMLLRLLQSTKSDVIDYRIVKRGFKKNNFYSDQYKEEWRMLLKMQCGRMYYKGLTASEGWGEVCCEHCLEERGIWVPYTASHFLKACPLFKDVRRNFEILEKHRVNELLREHEEELLPCIRAFLKHSKKGKEEEDVDDEATQNK